MKKIGLVLFIVFTLGTCNLGLETFTYAQETLQILTYYPAPYGVYQTVKIYNNNANLTQTNFTQWLTNAGLIIETNYIVDAYTPGIFWSTQDNNRTKPKAGIYLRERATSDGTYMYFGTSNAYATGITNNALVINPDGQIGIGTTNPRSDKLDIVTTLNSVTAGVANLPIIIRKNSATNNEGIGIGFSSALTGNDSIGAKIVHIRTFTNSQGDLAFYTKPNTTAGDTTTEKMRIKADGKVGVGTDDPKNSIDIEGNIAVGTGYSGTSVAPANGMIIEGNVGIGTIAPQNKLDVEGGLVVGAGYAGTFTAPSNGMLIKGFVKIGTTDPIVSGRLQVRENSSAVAILGENTSFGSGVSGKSLNAYGVRGESSHSYGIYGKSTTSYAGYFEGRVATTSYPGTGGAHLWAADVAELIPCAKDVEYGDITIINPDKDREAIKCAKENQSAAGVISESPQLCFGDREKAREKDPEKNWNFIALAGQIYAKVDASYGEIKRGDLLTTSPTPGHAMKAKPVGKVNGYPIYPQGCIIGKALEPLKDGKGKILVLVCLM